MVLNGQRVLPAKLDGSGYRFAYPDLRGALEATLGGSSGRDSVA